MVIGKYWSQHAPGMMKQLKYFKFRPGRNCHWWTEPAVLQAIIESKDVRQIAEELQKFHNKHNGFDLRISYNDFIMDISIESPAIFDYELFAALYIEELLQQYPIHVVNELSRNDQMHTIDCKASQAIDDCIDFIQIVSSANDADNSKELSLRYDCNVDQSNFETVKEELLDIAVKNRIETIKIYIGHDKTRINIMVFFENGRQGVKLKNKTNVSIRDIELALEMMEKENMAVRGFAGGYDQYPDVNNEIILKAALA